MRMLWTTLLISLLALAGCEPAAETEGEESAEGTEGTEGEGTEGEEPTEEPDEPAEPEQPAEPEGDSFVDGVFSSPRFNVRARLPEGWAPLDPGTAGEGPFGLGASEDSATIIGPDGSNIRMVIANSESIQLVGASFDNLDDRVGFENVNIIPERSQGGTFNGIPGYRTEGDALLRGDVGADRRSSRRPSTCRVSRRWPPSSSRTTCTPPVTARRPAAKKKFPRAPARSRRSLRIAPRATTRT